MGITTLGTTVLRIKNKCHAVHANIYATALYFNSAYLLAQRSPSPAGVTPWSSSSPPSAGRLTQASSTTSGPRIEPNVLVPACQKGKFNRCDREHWSSSVDTSSNRCCCTRVTEPTITVIIFCFFNGGLWDWLCHISLRLSLGLLRQPNTAVNERQEILRHWPWAWQSCTRATKESRLRTAVHLLPHLNRS